MVQQTKCLKHHVMKQLLLLNEYTGGRCWTVCWTKQLSHISSSPFITAHTKGRHLTSVCSPQYILHTFLPHFTLLWFNYVHVTQSPVSSSRFPWSNFLISSSDIIFLTECWMLVVKICLLILWVYKISRQLLKSIKHDIHRPLAKR
jgi:hypothetical protein